MKPDNIQVYQGKLGSLRRMGNHRAYLAFTKYHGMKERSKRIGASPPEMSVREFIGWWLEQMKTYSGKKPSVSRIDHSKGYSWDNFIIEELSENTRECAKRIRLHDKTKRRVFVYRKDNGALTGSFSSATSAASFFGINHCHLSEMMAKNRPIKKINFVLSFDGGLV